MPISTLLLDQFFVTLVLAAVATTASGGSFFEKDGAALRGYDPVAYFTEGKPVKGSPAYTVLYQGSMFHFASQANRDLFKGDAGRYRRSTMGSALTARRAVTRPRSIPLRSRSSRANFTSTTTQKYRRSGAPIFRDTLGRPTNWPTVFIQTKVFE